MGMATQSDEDRRVKFETASERWSWHKRSEWQPCGQDGCKDCATYQNQLDRYDRLNAMGKHKAADYWKQLMLRDIPHQQPAALELNESIGMPEARHPFANPYGEEGRKKMRTTAGDVIQFPSQAPEESDQQLRIEFYNRCAQVEKMLMDVFEDPRYESLTDEEIQALHAKARDLVWNSGIQFTQ